MLYLSAAPEMEHHETGPIHPERPERVRAVLAGIREAGLGEAVVRLPLRGATFEELERVHCGRT